MNDIQEKLFLFFSVLFSVFLLVIHREPESRDLMWKPVLPDFAAKNIEKIEISTPSETFNIKKERSTWLLQAEKDYYAETTVVEKILKIFAQVQCTTINNSPQEYGLDEPRISIKLADYTVSIGNPSPTNEGEYVMVGNRYCRTRTIITNRIPVHSNEYRSKQLLFHPISNVESIELSNGVIIEKTSGNWRQRAPFTVVLSHKKIDLWLSSIKKEEAVQFHKVPNVLSKKLIFTFRDSQTQFEWSGNTVMSTQHPDGFIGTDTLLSLLNIDGSQFYESMLLPNDFQNKSITHAEYVNAQGKVIGIGKETSFWQLITQPVFARIYGEYTPGNEELILYFGDDTKLRFFCTRADQRVLLSYPLEDVLISVPLDFLPEQE